MHDFRPTIMSALVLALVMTMMLTIPAVVSADTVGGALFVENVGQHVANARYAMIGGNTTMWIAEDGVWIQQADADGAGYAVKLSFEGSLWQHIEPFGSTDTKVSFFVGADPSGWKSSVPTYRGVRIVDLYPGTDLVISGSGPSWTWSLEPDQSTYKATHTQVIEQVELDVQGGELLLQENGNGLIVTPLGDIVIPSLDARPFDLNVEPVEIDTPEELGYATYLGGAKDEYVEDIQVDHQGCAYLVGWTQSSDFPTTPGTFDASLEGNKDAFVCKLAADGSSLLYATFLGGDGDDEGLALCLDDMGYAYLAGVTASSNFPITTTVISGTVDHSNPERTDAFCAKISPDGSDLIYSTYLGQDGYEEARGVDVDSEGNTYLTGFTTSEAFPTTYGAYEQDPDSEPLGLENVFVTKLAPHAEKLDYSFVVGTLGNERGEGIVVDDLGQAHVLGWTSHISFTTTPGEFGNTYGGSDFDVFCLQVITDGSGLNFSRLVGGDGWDEPGDIALDASGNVYLGGWTDSRDFPLTPGAYLTEWLVDSNDDGDPKAGFVVKLNALGTRMIFGTLMGGMGIDQVHGVGIDSASNVWLSGDTASEDMPTTEDALDRTYNGGETWRGDAFLCRLNAAGSELLYATYYGGTDADTEAHLALGPSDKPYIAGHTQSADLPCSDGAYATSLAGGWGDSFIAQIASSKWMIYHPLILKP